MLFNHKETISFLCWALRLSLDSVWRGDSHRLLPLLHLRRAALLRRLASGAPSLHHLLPHLVHKSIYYLRYWTFSSVLLEKRIENDDKLICVTSPSTSSEGGALACLDNFPNIREKLILLYSSFHCLLLAYVVLI